MYADVEYFTTITQESYSIITMSEDKNQTGTVLVGYKKGYDSSSNTMKDVPGKSRFAK